MKRTWWVATCAVGVVAGVLFGHATGRGAEDTDFEGSTFSKLSPAEKTLLAEFRTNYRRLKDFYTNVTMEARREFFRVPRPADGLVPPAPDAGLELEVVKKCVFRANGGEYYRVDQTVHDLADPSRIRGLRTAIVTPAESFTLSRLTPEARYYLAGHSEDKNEASGRLSPYWFFKAAYSNGPMDLEYALLWDRKDYTIESITVANEDGREIVSIVLLFENQRGWMRTQFRFDRARSWALLDVHLTAPNETGSKQLAFQDQHCVYVGESDGIPLLAECSMESAYEVSPGGRKRVMQREVIRIEKITAGAPSLSEFDAKALIGTVGRKTSRPNLAIVCGVIGVLLLVGGFWLRRRARTA